MSAVNIVEYLKVVGDKPFKINGYQRSDGSVVNLTVRMLAPDGYKGLVQDSIDNIDKFGDLLDNSVWEPARDVVMASLQKSLAPSITDEDKPKNVSCEKITNVTANVALVDDDSDKVVVYRVEVLNTETTVEPSKVVKSRDEMSAAKKKLMAALPVGRFCFRLNLYKGKYESIE